jgi:hypothetical protein
VFVILSEAKDLRLPLFLPSPLFFLSVIPGRESASLCQVIACVSLLIQSDVLSFTMRAMDTGKLLSVVGAALFAAAILMYFLSVPLGGVLKQHTILNDYCNAALIAEVFGMMFLLIGSIFLALKAQPAVSFSVAVGLLAAFAFVLFLREHHVIGFNEKSWTASLFLLSGLLLPMSAFYFIGGCIHEIRDRLNREKS